MAEEQKNVKITYTTDYQDKGQKQAEAGIRRTVKLADEESKAFDRAAKASKNAAKAKEQLTKSTITLGKQLEREKRQTSDLNRFANRIVKSYIAWRLVINTVSTAIGNMVEGVKEAQDELYGQTEATLAAKEAQSEFNYVLAEALHDLDETVGITTGLTSALTALTDIFILAKGAAFGFDVALQNINENMSGLLATAGSEFLTGGPGGGATAIQSLIMGGAGAAGFDEARAASAEAIRSSIEARERGAEAARRETDEFERQQKVIERMIRLSRQWDEELERHEKQIKKIANALKEDFAQAGRDYRDEIDAINRELAEAIEKIWSDAAEDAEDAVEKANKKIAKANKDNLSDIERMQAEHDLRMRQMQERFNLSRLQGDRLYQFERGMLVAEGDVLAIEELDARHKLEQQAEEENFRLQRKQMQEMFELQLKFQKQAAREQAAELRAALAEQLAEIAENVRERVMEEKKKAEELREQAKEDLKKELLEAREAAGDKLSVEDERHQKAKEKQAQQFIDLANQTNTDKDVLLKAWENIYGADGDLSQITNRFYAEELRKQALFQGMMAASMQSVGGQRPTGDRSGGGSSQPARAFAYGGEFIASKPTRITVGEGHRPERVVVQPLSAMSGNVSHHWAGGPIPIRGSGLGGANPAALNSAFNAMIPGLMHSFTTRLKALRGRRGY